jgi:hypothetical protein
MVEYEFHPIEGACYDGRSTVVARVENGEVVEHSIAGWVCGCWRFHGEPIEFEPTHYGTPVITRH